MAIPTLSSSGWVSDPINVLNKIYDYFLTTETNQSNLFKSELTSLQSLVASYSDDPGLLASKTKDSLRYLFGAYFEQVNVETSITAIKTKNGEEGRYNLNMNVTVMEKGKTYSLGRAIETISNELNLIKR